MSPETAAFLLSVLDQVNLSARDPQLVEKAQQVAAAKAELSALLPH